MYAFFTCVFLSIGIASGNNILAQLLEVDESKLSEDGKLNFTGLANKYGHQAEEKDVITQDGYILKMFHIPGNKNQAVLLVHGNTPTADYWITRGEISLAITMANKGYDVWAINLRGSRYSRRHVSLDPDEDKKEFYDFSFYEQAIHDLPSAIDFVLENTGQEQLLTIGHSVGTALMYVLGAEKPEYNDKIKLAVSLAPICFLDNLKGLPALADEFGPALLDAAEVLGLYEVVGYDQVAGLLQSICLQPSGYNLCIELVFFNILGPSEGFEEEFLPTFFGHFPGGSSLKMFQHLLQVIQRSEFAKYDYGFLKNMVVYLRPEPPKFDLSKVTMKSALFVGQQDYLATVADSRRLNASLGNVVHYQVLPDESFSHIDFVWSRYMPNNLYPDLFEVIDKYI